MTTIEEEPVTKLRLAELRIRKGMSQVELSRKTGISQGQLSLLEHGKHSPSLDKAVKLARALGVSVEELLD